MTVDPAQFMAAVRPALERGDAQALAHAVAQRWSAPALFPLLRCRELDIRRVAAIALGMLGDRRAIEPLAKALHDPDRQVVQMAEHALYTLWFQTGSASARCHLRQGMELLEAERYPAAAECFKYAIAADDTFVEAYHQCGLALHLGGEHRRALKYFCHAVRLDPHHFNALGGMGHCYTELGDLRLALSCYRLALRINPHLPCLARAIEHLQQRVSDQNDWSGIYTCTPAPSGS